MCVREKAKAESDLGYDSHIEPTKIISTSGLYHAFLFLVLRTRRFHSYLLFLHGSHSLSKYMSLSLHVHVVRT